MKPVLSQCFLAMLILFGSLQIGTAQELQYEDTFDEFGAEWGQPSKLISVQDGVLVLQLEPGWSAWPLNQGILVEDADISLRTRQVSGKALGYAAGLIFWAESNEKFYMFGISRDGSFMVLRRVGQKWLQPVNWRASDAIKKGLDEWNSLRVVTKGNKATLYVNDTELVSMKGQPPAGGGLIGFYGASPADEAITYEFDDLKVK